MPKRTNKKSSSPKLRFSNISRKQRIIGAILSGLIIAGVGVYLLNTTKAATPSGTYTDYFFTPGPEGLKSLQHELTIESLEGSPPYFWSHQFGFINGDGGYIGLQSRGGRVNGTVGKTAVFSIFGAGIYGTAGCDVVKKDFDGYVGKVGTSCRIPYEWVIGHKYQLTTKYVAVSNYGPYWSGWVKNLTTGVDTHIADINIPRTWKGLASQTIQWTEYFGEHPSSCEKLPLSRVHFTQPRSDIGAITGGPSNHTTTGVGVCSNSQVENVADGTIQQMGGYTATSKNPQTAPAPAPTPAPAGSPSDCNQKSPC